MVEIVRLESNERMPLPIDDIGWLLIEANDDGRFFGTGCGRSPSGEKVFYVSSAEDDNSLETAIAAATAWAEGRGVTCIWIETAPD